MNVKKLLEENGFKVEKVKTSPDYVYGEFYDYTAVLPESLEKWISDEENARELAGRVIRVWEELSRSDNVNVSIRVNGQTVPLPWFVTVMANYLEKNDIALLWEDMGALVPMCWSYLRELHEKRTGSQNKKSSGMKRRV